MTMETTKTSDTLLESAKMAEKWMNESSAAVMEIYNKQLNLASGYYTNYINSIWSNGKVPGGSQQFLDNYFGNKMAKSFWTPYSALYNNGDSNPLSSFEKMQKQYMDFNRTLFNDMTVRLRTNDLDWSSVGNEYKGILDKQIEATKKAMSTLFETYQKQLNFTMDTGKEMMNDMSNQFNAIYKQNQKNWSDMMQPNAPVSNLPATKAKEPAFTESKKHSNIAVM